MPVNPISRFLASKAGLLAAYTIAVALLVFVTIDVYTRYRAVAQMKAAISAAEQAEQVKKSTARPAGDMHQLASLQLFGTAKQALVAPEPVAAPATRLKLALLGIVATENGPFSRAIIQIDNKQTAVYEVGDSLPTGNARVHEILPDKILLMRNGKLESLAIDRPSLAKKDRKLLNTEDGRSSGKIEDKILLLPDEPDPVAKPVTAPPADS